VYLAVDIRPCVNGTNAGAHVAQVGLVNAQEEPATNKDVAWLFQPQLTVTAAVEQELAVFCPIDDPLDDLAAADGSPEDRHLRLLYRDELRHAIGRNIAARAHVRPGERHAYRLETTWLPAYEVPATIAPPAEDGSHLSGVELSMDALAAASPRELADGLRPLADGLRPLADGYAAWLGEQEARVAELPAALRDTARAAIFTARQCADRIRAGIELVSSPDAAGHETALAAFRFANEAMALQRRHTTIAARREADGLGFAEAEQAVREDGAKVASWRPFQLAFVLLNLPALTDPAHRERVPDGHQALVDLLFFPTGGGKTEAYLGLAAYTFAIRRLQKTIGTGASARSGEDGVAVLMRYTLRLLTAQQFQRAAALMCAAEVMRRSAIDRGDTRWGAEPFRIGLWVGSAVSPNWYHEAAEQVADVREAPTSRRAGVLQTLVCPWCGTTLLAMLFGRVNSRCPRHGYRHDDLDERTGCRPRHNESRQSRLPAVSSQPVVRLRPPDLIIQDELHLISGALGTTVGLFEAAVDELCRWPAGEVLTGPKIVASTATTKRAPEQVRGIFARDLAVFPPPVLDIADTFFSRQVPVTPGTPGRRYLGICAHGVRLKSAEIRLAEILLIAGQSLFDSYGTAADPYMTVVGYFNATRELAGMRRYLDDDVTTRVRRHGRPRGLPERIQSQTVMLAIEELTSRISSADISSVLKRLEAGFDPGLDTRPGSSTRTARAAAGSRSRSPRGSCWRA
jgi:hypothetical protein